LLDPSSLQLVNVSWSLTDLCGCLVLLELPQGHLRRIIAWGNGFENIIIELYLINEGTITGENHEPSPNFDKDLSVVEEGRHVNPVQVIIDQLLLGLVWLLENPNV